MAAALDSIEVKFKDILTKLEKFQARNADNVFNTGWLSIPICYYLIIFQVMPYKG